MGAPREDPCACSIVGDLCGVGKVRHMAGMISDIVALIGLPKIMTETTCDLLSGTFPKFRMVRAGASYALDATCFWLSSNTLRLRIVRAI